MDEKAARKEVQEVMQRIEHQRAVIDELSDQPDQQREASERLIEMLEKLDVLLGKRRPLPFPPGGE
jgi:hypothetical protein